MKRIYIVIIAIVASLALLYSSCSTNTYMGRWIKWRASDIEDYQKFPSYDFSASDTPFNFIPGNRRELDKVEVTRKKGRKLALVNLLESSGTTAFIIVKDDTLLYEKYFNEYNRSSVNTSFSVAKSITSLVIGKAIDEGLIHAADDPVTQYLPELRNNDEGYDQVRISHLLNMRSGIQFVDHDLPWGDKPKAYYHPRLRERIMELPIKFEPGSRFQYNSYNPILAGIIVEKVAGMSPAAYFEKHIWDKMGMEYAGSWSQDSEGSRMTKMESGINLRAIDFAKFGRLVLNSGNWNGQQLVSKDWMATSFDILPELNVPDFGDEIYYKNFWWMYSKNGETSYIISGWGHLGQFLYIFPDQNLIMIRMGKETGNLDSWGVVFKELAAVID